MDSAVLSQIVVAGATLGASLGGYLLAGVNEHRRDRRTLRREMELRATERVAVREDEMHAIQRETLLALQDAVQAMARLTGRALHFDHMQARKGQFTQFPEKFSDEMLANGIDVKRLMTRVLDDEVRGAVDTFNSETVRLSLHPLYLKGYEGEALERRADARMYELNEAYSKVSDLLGKKVREEISWRPVDSTNL